MLRRRQVSPYLYLLGCFLLVTATSTLSHAQSVKTPRVISMPGDPLTGNGHVQRTSLTFEDLFSAQNPKSPIDDASFALPAGAAMPQDKFEGRLQLIAPEKWGDTKIVSTKYGVLNYYKAWKHLPNFSFEFVQNGSYLIPVKQGLIITGHRVWNLIIGPGRVWSEQDDRGYSRAAFPFALVERNQNCVHNGSMTFLFSNTKTPRISGVRYQITQETCAYMKVDMWGQVPANYTQVSIPNNAELANAQAGEFAHRLPRKPFAALTEDFPDAHLDMSAFLRDRKFPEDVTTYGLYIKGINYVSGCPTRYGEYAFCSDMRLPSYSTAKSAFAAVAMMRLGQLYGKDLYSQKIPTYLPRIGQKASWANVSFDNTIDMATGHFNSSGFQIDENSPPEAKFLAAEKYQAKLKDASTIFPPNAKPGTVWVYQSSNTFLVAQAMTAFLQEKRGTNADLFDLVRDDIYKPLHVSQGGLTTIRTDNSETGRPDGYFGLFYNQDDIAKIGDFLNNGNGKLGEQQVLDPVRLRESLFRDPSIEGLPVSDSGTVRYNHGFWAEHFTRKEYPSNACDFWVPYMSGYGGISVLLLPNGAIFYIFSDSNEFSFQDAVGEIGKLSSYCRPTGE